MTLQNHLAARRGLRAGSRKVTYGQFSKSGSHVRVPFIRVPCYFGGPKKGDPSLENYPDGAVMAPGPGEAPSLSSPGKFSIPKPGWKAKNASP